MAELDDTPEIISVSGSGFPSGVSAVLQTSHYQQDCDWVLADLTWPHPSILRRYRFYAPPVVTP